MAQLLGSAEYVGSGCVFGAGVRPTAFHLLCCPKMTALAVHGKHGGVGSSLSRHLTCSQELGTAPSGLASLLLQHRSPEAESSLLRCHCVWCEVGLRTFSSSAFKSSCSPLNFGIRMQRHALGLDLTSTQQIHPFWTRHSLLLKHLLASHRPLALSSTCSTPKSTIGLSRSAGYEGGHHHSINDPAMQLHDVSHRRNPQISHRLSYVLLTKVRQLVLGVLI